MDNLRIHRLRVPAQVGILPWEREKPQEILLDLTFRVDAAHAALTDDIHQTVDYAAVRESVCRFLQENRFNLIETLAEKLAEMLKQTFSLERLQLTVIKPKIFEDAEGVSITVER